MTHEIVNKHDITFKEVFSQKRIAKDFIINSIPKSALDVVDLDTLELVKDTFVNKDLKESFSDLIYKVKIKDEDAYICFLLEHKSYKDKMTVFQIQRYILESWMMIVQKENKDKLPIIVPLVIYHGKEKWNLDTDLRDMIYGFYDLPDYFKERIPVFKYDFLNIGEYEEEDFDRFKLLTAMMLRAFKYAFEKDIDLVLRTFLLDLHELAKHEPISTVEYYGQIYLKYIELNNKNITEEDIKRQVDKLDGKGAVSMGLLERREQIGIEKGRIEGEKRARIKIAKNLLRAGAEVPLVAKSTGLSMSEVEDIQNKLK
ncbi:MAG: Rpn family recombination-promoting nuclease/putative transposase [Clostridiales bacterium]|nr:Rpn family recombination-promoting nuclease/putative transposase [Clostridiales bacterium]